MVAEMTVSMVLVLGGSAATAESTKVVRSLFIPHCSYRWSWIIGSVSPPHAGVAVYECDNLITLALEQFQRSGADLHATTRATLELSRIGQHQIVPCLADREMAFSDIVVLTGPSHHHPISTFTRAWKVDSKTWQFTERDPLAVECEMWPPADD